MATVKEYMGGCLALGATVGLPPAITGIGMITATAIDYERYEVCDTVTATITGNVVPNFATPNLSVNTAGLTITNDTIINFVVDWGFKLESSPTVSLDLIAYSIPEGQYELRVFAQTQSGNRLLIASNNYTWDGTTVTGLATQTANRSYIVSVAQVLSNWEDASFVNITNVDGSAYTPVGLITRTCPEVVDEFMSSGGGVGGSSAGKGTWRSERITSATVKTFNVNTLWNLALFVKGGGITVNDGTSTTAFSVGDRFEWGKDFLNQNTITITTFAGTDLEIVYILK